MISILVSVAGSLVTGGCNNTKEQRALAVAGAAEFLVKYNDQAFTEMYDEADLYVHRKASRRWWMERCSSVRAELGALKDFKPMTNNDYPIGNVGIVWVSGPAISESGPATLRLDWEIRSGSPKLFNFQVERGAGTSTISVPGYTAKVLR